MGLIGRLGMVLGSFDHLRQGVGMKKGIIYTIVCADNLGDLLLYFKL